LFLLNVLFRPVLMVFGFLVGSMFTIGLGTLLLKMFPVAVSGAQGNSITGLASIIGFICIFFILCNLIIQGSFNLIHIIPDQVLGWVGNAANAHLGRDLESKVNNLFVAGSKNASGMAAGIRPRDGGQNKSAVAGGGGGTGGSGGGGGGASDPSKKPEFK